MIGGRRRPHPHERHLGLVGERDDGERHRRVDAAEEGRDLLLEDELAGRDDALRRARLVVAADELDHASAEDAAGRIDLVHRDGEAAGDRLAGLRRRPRQGGHEAELDGVGRLRCLDREEGGGGRGDGEAPAEPRRVTMIPISHDFFSLSSAGRWVPAARSALSARPHPKSSRPTAGALSLQSRTSIP